MTYLKSHKQRVCAQIPSEPSTVTQDTFLWLSPGIEEAETQCLSVEWGFTYLLLQMPTVSAAVLTQDASEQVPCAELVHLPLSTPSSLLTCSCSGSQKETKTVEGLWLEKDSYWPRCQVFAPGAGMFNFWMLLEAAPTWGFPSICLQSILTYIIYCFEKSLPTFPWPYSIVGELLIGADTVQQDMYIHMTDSKRRGKRGSLKLQNKYTISA